MFRLFRQPLQYITWLSLRKLKTKILRIEQNCVQSLLLEDDDGNEIINSLDPLFCIDMSEICTILTLGPRLKLAGGPLLRIILSCSKLSTFPGINTMLKLNFLQMLPESFWSKITCLNFRSLHYINESVSLTENASKYIADHCFNLTSVVLDCNFDSKALSTLLPNNEQKITHFNCFNPESTEAEDSFIIDGLLNTQFNTLIDLRLIIQTW